MPNHQTYYADDQLAKALDDLKARLTEQRSLLFDSGPRTCVCAADGLCAHHAEIANRLQDAIAQMEQAITCARRYSVIVTKRVGHT
ncbi:MAG TPA: hypothetical protein VII92_01400 [Anaerolineae bacterium]